MKLTGHNNRVYDVYPGDTVSSIFGTTGKVMVIEPDAVLLDVKNINQLVEVRASEISYHEGVTQCQESVFI